MVLEFVRNDIAKMKVDVIVNAANSTLLGGGGVDGAIHRAAGPELLKECKSLHGCEVGEAKITNGYKLPAKYVIHTVGPMYIDGKHDEKKLLENCYKNSLTIACEKKLKSIAFPVISSGAYGYPKKKAVDVAVNTIKNFFTKDKEDYDIKVYLVVFDRDTFDIGKKKTDNIRAYITTNYVNEMRELDARGHGNTYSPYGKYVTREEALDLLGKKSVLNVESIIGPSNGEDKKKSILKRPQRKTIVGKPCVKAGGGGTSGTLPKKVTVKKASVSTKKSIETEEEIVLKNKLNEILNQMDIGFNDALFKIIDEKGLKDADVYKKSNIDRRTFSKIRNDNYHPSKETALALCIGLELDLDTTNDLLQKAGYSMSGEIKSDAIVKYFISNNNYDIYEINKTLFGFDQVQLGSVKYTQRINDILENTKKEKCVM